MRRSLLGGLILSLGWLAPAASAGEVLATSSAQPAVVCARSSSCSAAAAVTLGRPRLVRAASASADPGLLPVSYQAPAAAPALDNPPPRSSLFAVERAAFMTPAPADPAEALRPPLAKPLPTTGSTVAGAPPAAPLGFPTDPCADGCANAGDAMLPDADLVPARPTGVGYRFYGSAEYLAWRTKNDPVPPLATTSTNPFANGILAPSQFVPPSVTSTSSVLFGGPLNYGTQSGARFRLGYWFDGCKPFAIEGSYFFLGQGTSNFAAASNSSTVIARPFYDLNDNAAFSQLVASPLAAAGMLSITSPSSLSGADLNLRCPVCCYTGCNGGYRLDLLTGFAFYNLREGLYITEQGMNLPNAPVGPGQAFRVDDRFDTANRFYGAQIGFLAEAQFGRWFVNTRQMFAIGDTHQVLNINGSSTLVNTNPADIASMGLVQHAAGGLLALPNANIGRFTRDRFGFVPNLNFNIGYQVTNNLRIFVGYNFLFWSNVLRPGQAIDPRLDITKIPFFAAPGTAPTGLPNPVPQFKGTSYWAQGINVGLSLRY